MGDHEAPRDHLLSNKTYDRLKHLAQIGLPALGTLYFALSQIWGFPNGEEIVGTIVAVDTFLGVLLGYSSRSYNSSKAKYDGEMVVEELEDGGKTFHLNFDGDPYELDKQQSISFRVKPYSQNRSDL